MDAVKVMLTVLYRAQSVTDFQCQAEFVVKVLKQAGVYGAYYEQAIKEWDTNLKFYLADASESCRTQIDNKNYLLKIAYTRKSIEFDEYTALTLKWFNEWDLTLKELRSKQKQKEQTNVADQNSGNSSKQAS